MIDDLGTVKYEYQPAGGPARALGEKMMDRKKALDQLRIMQAWHEDNGDGPNADYDAICFAIEAIERSEDLEKLITALEQEHAKLREIQGVIDTDCISRQAAIDDIRTMNPKDAQLDIKWVEMWLKQLPPAQPETATVTIGRTRGGITMWYECDACGEPIDQNDCYCRKCGRKLKHE